MAVGIPDEPERIHTGYKEIKQIDVNPNSPTFGEFRWVDGGYDPDTCPLPRVPVYSNQEIQDLVFRNDCGVGYDGGSVFYTIPAGMFSSTVSQADANLLATIYFNNTKQNFANANASCIYVGLGDAEGGGGSGGGGIS
jgi:hypothetical protein